MDKLTQFYEIIYPILKEYADLPYRYQNLKHKLIISNDHKDYLLMTIGWDDDVKVHGCLVHLEIIDNKIWIHRDGLEDGIASDLVRAGIPKSEIVLAFHPPDVRKFTEFAIS
ncbi:XisI protein [Crocosphaera sp. XPORK-15E]|uniref:XisI protein n=1 Tax=Crocosphaera sp. XPORK-15E TaxID=3110247 RepID=UPI002B21BCD6|nr:XisI protein [Crocosphaera sp. XPORK-15E]MEA5533356.1 XisI protein [Crocosphaera sp. XPORK-15E]